MHNYGIRVNQNPWMWTTNKDYAERIAEKAGAEIIGPLPDEEAHALGMSYTGRFAQSMIDMGKSVIYLPCQ